jgi:hypothetical protein
MRSVRVVPIAVVCIMVVAAGCGGAGAPAATGAKASNPSQTESAWMLKQDMRKLWTDHVVWTRDYVIAAIAGQPDAQSAADRLMRNQEDIGNAVAKYYGDEAGRQLTGLLKQHIGIAVDVVKAAKAGDKAALTQADDRWQQNGVEIADFLSKANPNWPRETLVAMMKKHLETTTTEVVARLDKNWNDDVKAFDAVYDHILDMSDALADGIVKQFPGRFEKTESVTN